MTSSTAENRVAGEKEKMEKRRALGRGLASLLPGPRVVGAADTGAKAPDISQGGDAALKGRSSTGASNVAVSNVGIANLGSSNLGGSREAGGTSSVATHAAAGVETGSGDGAGTRAGVPAPHLGAAEVGSETSAAVDDASLRLAGRTKGSGPAYVASSPASVSVSSFPTSDSLAVETAVSHGRKGEMLVDENGEPATIMAMADPSRVPANLVINIPIHDIDKNPFQTRYVEDDDKLEELAESIKTSGVVQPILVRPSDEDEDRYILVMGERRLHASKKAGKTTIPAMVRKLSPQQAAEMTIIENLQREDLSPLEQAQAFKVLSQEFAMTQAEIAERVGLSRESVSNYMRLLKLPREVMEMLAEKRISFAKAKELLKLEENDRIAQAALYAVEKGMNLEQIEMLVLRMDGMLPALPDMPGVVKEKKPGVARWVDPNVRAAQVELERLLGVRVRIRDRKGRGKIVIEYVTVDDYDRVVGMLRGK